jgi:hypothetical protein
MVDRLIEAWKLYKSIAKDELELYEVPFEKRSSVSVGDLRELMVFPPIYFAITEEVLAVDHKKLFKCVVLTEEVQLGWINRQTPLVPLYDQKALLVCLPFWVYLDEQFLFDYTVIRCGLGESFIEWIESYAKSAPIPDDVRGKYIRHVMKLLAPFNTNYLLAFIDEIENYNS